MPEAFSNRAGRLKKLNVLFNEVMEGADLNQLANENKQLIESCVPADIVWLIDNLVSKKIAMDDLKAGINKLMSLLHNSIANHPYNPPAKDSYLGCLIENNFLLDEKLQKITPLLQRFEEYPEDVETKYDLLILFKDLERVNRYSQIKENILFPEIEKFIEKHRCISVMGSFHNDVREKMKETIAELSGEKVNYSYFKKVSAELFFLMYTLKFREERILYAFIQDTISDEVLNSLFNESLEIGSPFFQPKKKDGKSNLISLN